MIPRSSIDAFAAHVHAVEKKNAVALSAALQGIRNAESRVAQIRRSVFDASVAGLTVLADKVRIGVPARALLKQTVGHDEHAGDPSPATRLRSGSSLRPDESSPVAPTSSQSASAAASPSCEGVTCNEGWLYENLRTPGQHILPVLNGPHDYMVRLVIDDRVTAVQPPSISVKTTLASVGDARAVLRGPNVTIRDESSSIKTSTGTKGQFGYDVTRADLAKQHEYIDTGEPVMDLISIETKGELVVGRIRADLAFEKGSAPNPKALIQDALSAGGYMRWRRVWIDKTTGERSGIDVVLGMKSEASFEVGLGAERGGLGTKADIEATVRFFGPQARALDTHALTQKASEEVAKLLQREPALRVAINSSNHGDRDVARFKITQHLYFGGSVWQFAPRSVSGGLNQGHAGVALAIRVNDLLHEKGLLANDLSVSDASQARALLRSLWQRGTPQQQESWARQLSNRIGINFGLPEVARFNALALSQRPMSYREREYRRLFLEDAARSTQNPSH